MIPAALKILPREIQYLQNQLQSLSDMGHTRHILLNHIEITTRKKQDPLRVKHALFQLSYDPDLNFISFVSFEERCQAVPVEWNERLRWVYAIRRQDQGGRHAF